MAIKLRRMQNGRFVRNLGPTGGQQKFYLGRDERDALLRVAQLEKLWDWWERICLEIDDTPAWNEYTLAVAKAIAKGRATVEVEIDVPEDLAVGILSGLQSIVPHITIRLLNEDQQKAGQDYWREEGQRLLDEGKRLLQQQGNQRLHEAIGPTSNSSKRTNAFLRGMSAIGGKQKCGKSHFAGNTCQIFGLPTSTQRRSTNSLDSLPNAPFPGRLMNIFRR